MRSIAFFFPCMIEKKQERIYRSVIKNHFSRHNQMLFLMGPRQSGKTTLTEMIKEDYTNYYYFNWDSSEHQALILKGNDALANYCGYSSNPSKENKTLIVLDELHKFNRWKNFLKGFYDLYKDYFHIIVTVSVQLCSFFFGG